MRVCGCLKIWSCESMSDMHMYVNVLESVCVCALPFVINVKHSYTHKTACTRTLSSARTCTNKYSYNASNIHTHIHTAAAARMGTLSSTLTCINKHLCSAYKTHTHNSAYAHIIKRPHLYQQVLMNCVHVSLVLRKH